MSGPSAGPKAPEIRNPTAEDLPAILDILNHYIMNHHSIFDTEAWTVQQKLPWFEKFHTEGPYQLLAARENGRLLGYTHSTRWRPKAAYDVTAETTVYVHPEARGRSVGTALLRELVERLRPVGLHHLVAGVAQPNDASNRLHERIGYRKVGTFAGVGYKFGKSWDVTWYQFRF